MIPVRCPRCFRRLGDDETVHICQMVTPNIKNRKPKAKPAEAQTERTP